MKRLITTVLIAFLAVAICEAATPKVQRLLPVANAVKGFTILANSLQYGKGSDISKIYDGGYELYTKNGVTEAARQMYQCKDDYVEVTVHAMTSPKAATSFLTYWQKENKASALTKAAGSTGFLVTKPTVMSYFIKGSYFVTVAAFHPAERAKKDAAAFRTAIAKAM